jgi:cell division protein FtsB
MVIRKGFHSAIKVAALYGVATLAVLYFLYHARSGARGLESNQALAITLTDLKSEHESLVAERVGWDDRVRLMLREATERDILDERARAVLGRVHRNDVVIMMMPPT